MALFNLSNIKVEEPENRKTLSPGYVTSTWRYPSDIGSLDKGHYMVIHINVQEKTSYAYEADRNSQPTIFNNRTNLKARNGQINTGDIFSNIQKDATAIKNYLSATSIGGRVADGVAGGLNSVGNATNSALRSLGISGDALLNEAKNVTGGIASALTSMNQINFMRTIKRTTDSIALYMPNTLNFAQNQSYSDLKLGGENLSTAVAGYSELSDYIKGGTGATLGKNMTPFIASLLKSKLAPLLGTNSTAAVFASAFGVVENPRLELLYTSPSLRTFSFEFMFYPRDEQEASDVQRIIQNLKFHQAPELLKGTAGYFMVPPSEFDIEFYYNGQINNNIPKISTCVLTSINADYAPNGFHAYEVPGEVSPGVGRTGMPVGIRLTLQFHETEVMTKANYDPSGDNY